MRFENVVSISMTGSSLMLAWILGTTPVVQQSSTDSRTISINLRSGSVSQKSPAVQQLAVHDELMKDLLAWQVLGEEHTCHDPEEVPPTAAALDALRGGLILTVQRPDVWGPTGDGGFFVEQHDHGTVSMLRVAANGEARLTTFRDGERIASRTLI